MGWDSESATCNSCRRSKPHNEFYARTDRRYKRPVRSSCKECEKRDASQRYFENPRRIRANMKVHRAVKSGILERKPCEICGSPNVEAHHDNYDKPLEVRWLCPKHHQAHHRATR